MAFIDNFNTALSSFQELDGNVLIEMYSKNLKGINEYGIHDYSSDEPFSVLLWRHINDKLFLSINFEFNASVNIQNGSDLNRLGRNNNIGLAYVVKGKFTQLIAGQHYTFSQGDICIFDRNTERADSKNFQDNFVVFIHMNEEFFKSLNLSELEKDEFLDFLKRALSMQRILKQFILFKSIDNKDHLSNLIEQIITEKKENQKGTSYVIKGLMIRIFDKLIKHYDFRIFTKQSKNTRDLLFVQIEDYIKRHFQHVTVKELSNVFHFQEDYFNRLIKKHTGMSFTRFLRKIRLSKFEEILLNTDLPISKIIESVGYESRYHFYRYFKEQHNMTPEQYRKSFKRK